jgi:amino acid transporter
MSEKRTTLARTLKAHWVWAIALGSSIGWGAFVQPTNWMSQAGPLGVIIGFSIGAFLMMLIAISYGFLIRSFPVSGGEFAYAYASLGRTHAFICGWFLTLGYICIVALNASAFALMFKYVFPDFIQNMHMYTIAGWDVYFTEIIIATIGIAIFTLSNYRGSGLSGQMQFYFCVIMLAAVFILTIWVGSSEGATVQNLKPFFNPETSAFASIIAIVAIAPWAYVGFDNVPQAAEEFKFSSKKATSLIIFSLIASALLYSLMILATGLAIPWMDVVEGQKLWGTGEVITSTLGNVGLAILVVAVCMGIFTGLNGFIISSSRLLFAMSRAKILPEAFGKLHPKFKTPTVGIIFTAAVAFIAPWFGRQALTWVVDMSSIGVSIAYFYTCFAAFKFTKWSAKEGLDTTQYKVAPITKFISIIGMLASIGFVLLLLVPGSPAFLSVQSRLALVVWIVLGTGFFLAKRKEFYAIPIKKLNFLVLGTEDTRLQEEN